MRRVFYRCATNATLFKKVFMEHRQRRDGAGKRFDIPRRKKKFKLRFFFVRAEMKIAFFSTEDFSGWAISAPLVSAGKWPRASNQLVVEGVWKKMSDPSGWQILMTDDWPGYWFICYSSYFYNDLRDGANPIKLKGIRKLPSLVRNWSIFGLAYK